MIAEAALRGDAAVLERLARTLLIPRRNNFVERPWGGTKIREFKRLHSLPDQARATGLGIGECFELAAYDADEESSRFPSVLECADGSLLSLPELLEKQGRAILGESFVARYGSRLPLLPKTLDVKELLSVQGHPAGHTEVYIVIDAEPGATLRLGFNADLDAGLLSRDLHAGLARQTELVALLGSDPDLLAFQRAIKPWLANRTSGTDEAEPWLSEFLVDSSARARAPGLLQELKTCYWKMLDSMNAIELEPGQVIYNATPQRFLSEGQLPSAEVHALGNPEELEFVALEIRLPGPTFRAWDNVRFPQRRVDIDAAIPALNLKATSPADFIRDPVAVPGQTGVYRSVDCEFFRVDHLRPAADGSVALPPDRPLCLHVLEGGVSVRTSGDGHVADLGRGESALVPVGLGECGLESTGPAHVVSVGLPV